MNEHLFFLINSIRSPAVDTFMELGTRLGNFFNMPWLLLFLAGLLVLARTRPGMRVGLSPSTLAGLMVALVLGYALSGLLVASLKFGLQLPRPSVVLGAQVLHSHEIPDSPYSFPSGHSAFAMLVAASFWRRTGRMLKALLVAYVLWVGISRVSLGMHFPGDVLSGYAVGALGAWSAATLWSRFWCRTVPNRPDP